MKIGADDQRARVVDQDSLILTPSGHPRPLLPTDHRPSISDYPAVHVPLASGALIVDATFVARPNRFVVEARLGTGELVRAHCADRGRLLWLVPEMPLLVGVRPEAGRKTGFQVAAAWHNAGWASLDTHLPNRLIEQALRAAALPQFREYPTIQREVRHGASRFDFRLHDGLRQCYVEVKSAGNAADGLAQFPDAPTERGRRHLQELAALAQAGTRAALIFVAQHSSARAVAPDRAIDPAFADALGAAARAGVELYAYCCPIDRSGITLMQAIPCLSEG